MTARLSASCDVRVIWGGDGTVRTIRATPLPPHATELTFPDRSSIAAIRTAAYTELTATARERVYQEVVERNPDFVDWMTDHPHLGVVRSLTVAQET